MTGNNSQLDLDTIDTHKNIIKILLICFQDIERKLKSDSKLPDGRFKPASNFVLLIVPRRYFCGGSFCFMSWCLIFFCAVGALCMFGAGAPCLLLGPPGSNWCFSFARELVGYSAPRDLHRRAAYSICESLFLIHQDVYHDLFVCP